MSIKANANTLTRRAVLGIVLILISGQASAVVINRTFIASTAPANAVGTGNLGAIFNTAADWWEAAILDAFTLNLSFQWGPLGPLGLHQLQTQAGGRETAGLITFDNDQSTNWWLDGTPTDASEFGPLQTTATNLGGGLVNDGRFYTGGMGLAAGNFDLLNTAIHEIGHSLGMSSRNFSYQGESWPDNDVDVMAPLPFAGTVIQTRNGNTPELGSTSNAHFLTAAHGNASLGRVVSTGSRFMISCIDVLANAQISGFSNINCDPQLVPEPASLGLLGISLFALALIQRRRGRTAEEKEQRTAAGSWQLPHP